MQRARFGTQRSSDQTDQRPLLDPVADQGSEMTLHDIIALFRRHWLLFMVVVGLVIGGTLAFILVTPPVYTATGEVFVSPSTLQANAESMVRNQGPEIADVPNEAALLRSRQLASTVIRSLDLEYDPEFVDEEKLDSTTTAENRLDSVIDVFLDELAVEPEEGTRVIKVKFDSEDPVKAADIVNSLMDLYIVDQLTFKRQTLERAAQQLRNEVAELEGELKAAEQAVRDFREANGLVQTQATDLTANRINDLNIQVVQAEADEASLRAELAQLEQALSQGSDGSTAPRVLNAPLIQSLREQENELVRRQAELSTQYGPKHPSMIQVRQELLDVRRNIGLETRKVVESLRSEVAAAGARVESLQSNMRDVQRSAVKDRSVEAQLQELINEAGSKRDMLNSFRVRLRGTESQRNLIEPNARIYARAETPSEPSFPRKGKMLGIAGFVGLILGIVVVMLLGSLRRTIETTDEVERITQYRSLGIVPKIPRMGSGAKTAARIMDLYTKKPYDAFSQSMKGVRSTLYVANGSRSPKTVLVTSAAPGEGKTTFALAYASLCASFGEKVILLDCDFGRPDLHKKMNVSNDLGIANYLMGEVDLETVIRDDGRTGMDYITSGTLPPSAAELSRSSALKGIIDSLAWDYDVVVVDTAPVLAMSDSQILSTMVEATVFVTRWRKTRMENAAAAVARLDDLGARSVAGFIMTGVPMRGTQANHATAYYAAYHR
ncbi:MAG: GumC family protein [Alphaproteobacteria bacterium]